MPYFYDHFKCHVEEKGLTLHSVQFKVEIAASQFSLWKKPKDQGGRLPSDNEIKKIAAFAELKLKEDTMLAWRALDEYGVEILTKAVKIAKQ